MTIELPLGRPGASGDDPFAELMRYTKSLEQHVRDVARLARADFARIALVLIS